MTSSSGDKPPGHSTTSGAPGGGPTDRPGGGAALSAGADPFDIWLQRSLRDLYGRVAEEPIPEELLRLIEADRSRRGPR